MNKNVKASIAIAAGVVLLMGGAGSLAYWNDSQSVGAAGSTISAGTLTATATGAGTWKKSFNGGTETTVTNLTNIVPGNRLVYTQTFTVNASGSDLYFTITPTAGSIVAGSGSNGTALASALSGATSTFAVTNNAAATGTTIAPSTTSGVYKVGAGATATTITVTWTIDWPFGTAPANNTSGDNAAKAGSVTLSGGAVTLTQVATP